MSQCLEVGGDIYKKSYKLSGTTTTLSASKTSVENGYGLNLSCCQTFLRNSSHCWFWTGDWGEGWSEMKGQCSSSLYPNAHKRWQRAHSKFCFNIEHALAKPRRYIFQSGYPHGQRRNMDTVSLQWIKILKNYLHSWYEHIKCFSFWPRIFSIMNGLRGAVPFTLCVCVCALLFTYISHVAYFKTHTLINTHFHLIFTTWVGKRNVIMHIK